LYKIGFVYPGYENLGVECLSASLKKAGFKTRLFLDPILFSESGFINNGLLSGMFSFREHLLREMLEYAPDLVCFSVITDNYLWATAWAREIKRRLNVPVVFGGIHPTSVPERVIEESCVDYLCIGEVTVQNNIRPLISDLDALPFPDKDIYYLSYPIFRDGYLISTSRGCPFSCSYCCNNVYHSLYKEAGKVVRRRSIDSVIEELVLAKDKYKSTFVHFVDDVFNSDANWLSIFLNRYGKEIRLPFSCYIYPDLANDSTVKRLKGAGCFKVQMGLQVFDDRKRKTALKRNSRLDNLAEAINSFKKSDIYVTCDSIFGFPDATEEEYLSLSRFYNEHLPDHCENFWLRYYPKTDVTTWALDNGYIDSEKKEKIEKGEFDFGLFRKSEHGDTKTYTRKFIILLILYHFLPKGVRVFILKKRLYRLLPPVGPLVLLIIARIFNHPKYDFNTIRTIRRYLYFSVSKLRSFGNKKYDLQRGHIVG